MLIGYARVSTEDQNIDLQTDALKEKNCDKIFTEIISGANKSRPKLDECINFARKNDKIVVWRLDRLGRSLKDLIDKINLMQEREIGFISLQESFDTTTSNGKLIFHIFAALSEFERSLIIERTTAGLKAARIRGRYGGRPLLLNDKSKLLLANLIKDRTITINTICETMRISRSTYYRYLNRA